jgi:hypothetical protein
MRSPPLYLEEEFFCKILDKKGCPKKDGFDPGKP